MELTAQDILAFLPLGIAMVLALRLIVGVRTIGAFAPALLALTVMQVGVQATTSMFLVAGGTGLMVAPILDRLALPRQTRLAVLVATVCTALVATGAITADTAVFPLVVMAIVVERTWESIRVDGPAAATRLSAATIVVAGLVAAVLSVLAPYVTGHHWLATAAFGIVTNLAVGSYRGLRLTELRRFAPLLAHRSAPVAS